MHHAGSHHYFVDEAGDLTLFDKRGQVIVGSPGVSRCFVVAAARLHDPPALAARLDELRAQLIADPYLAAIPSMRPGAGKTARLFHAKDDVPEVRREVFRILRDCDVQVFAAFRRKSLLAEEVAAHFRNTGEKLGPDHIYDGLVTSIFLNRLHLADENHVVFARRGKSARNVALQSAVRLAKSKFEQRWRKGIDRPTTVSSSTPSEHAGLQATDYYLWALQRMLERQEDRYFNYLAPAFRLIIDRDDTRQRGYGAYYTASANPLTLDGMMPVT